MKDLSADEFLRAADQLGLLDDVRKQLGLTLDSEILRVVIQRMNEQRGDNLRWVSYHRHVIRVRLIESAMPDPHPAPPPDVDLLAKLEGIQNCLNANLEMFQRAERQIAMARLNIEGLRKHVEEIKLA